MDQTITDTVDIEERDDDYYEMMDYRREAEEAERDEAEEKSSKEQMNEFLTEKITNGEDIGSAEDRAPYRHILLEEARQKLEKNKNTDYDLLFQAFSKLSEQFAKNIGADNLLDVLNRISYQVSYINEYGDRFLSSSFFSGISKGGREKRSLVREICGYVKKDLAEFTEKSAYAAMVPNYGSVDDLIKFKTDNIKDEPVEVDDSLADNGRELLSSEMKLTKKSSADGIEYQVLNECMDKVDNELNTKVNKDNYSQSLKSLKSEYYQLVTYAEEYLHTHSGKRWSSVGKKRAKLVKEVLFMCAKDMTIIEAVGSTLGSTENAVSWKELINKNGNIIEANQGIKDNVEETLAFLGNSLGNDLNVMTSQQFKNLIHMTESDIPQGVEEIIYLLDIYHEQNNVSKDKLTALKTVTKNIIPLIFDKCKTLKKQYKNNSQLLSAVNVLETQCDRRNEQYKSDNIGAGIGQNEEIRSLFFQYKKKPENPNDYETELNDTYSDYSYMSDEEYEEMSDANQYNFGEYKSKLYGKNSDGTVNPDGKKYGYILSDNSFKINNYIRAGRKTDDQDPQWSQKADETIDTLSAAAKVNVITKKTRLIRLLTGDYLKYVFGLNKEIGLDDAASAINKSTGKIITDQGFMCVGYKADYIFASYPIMLTLLCDPGTNCFATKNKKESELILDINTSYMILGAVSRYEKKKEVRLSSDKPEEENGEIRRGYHGGLEIIAKVL